MGSDGLGVHSGRRVLNQIHVPQNDQEHLFYAQWLQSRIPEFAPIGVKCIALWHGDRIAAVCGFANAHYNRVESFWACDIPRAVTRGAILTILSAAFIPPLSKRGITATATKGNKRARRFMEGIGFKQEGVMRRCGSHGENVLIYGLLLDDFLCLIERYKGAEARQKFAGLAGVKEGRHNH